MPQGSDPLSVIQRFQGQMPELQTLGDYEIYNILSAPYQNTCGESPGAYADSYSASVGADNFAKTMENFFGQLNVAGQMVTPALLSDEFRNFLGGGEGCPEGSPRGQGLKLAQAYGQLWPVLLTRYLSRIDEAEQRQVDEQMDQVEFIVNALGEGLFSVDGLNAMRSLWEILQGPNSTLGYNLLRLVKLDDDGNAFVPKHLPLLIREAFMVGDDLGARTQVLGGIYAKRMALPFSTDSIQAGDLEQNAWEWLNTRIADVNEAFQSNDAYLISLLALLSRGEVGLVDKFLDVLKIRQEGELENNVYALIHVAASQELTTERRSIIDRALEILMRENGGLLEMPDRPHLKLLDYIAVWLSYPVTHTPIEQGLVALLDKLLDTGSYSREAAHMIHNSEYEIVEGSHIKHVAPLLLENLLVLNFRLEQEKAGSEARQVYIANSVAAQILGVVQTQRLNGVRLLLMENALAADMDETKRVKDEAQFYLGPLLDPQEQPVLDRIALTRPTVDVYVADYQDRSRSRGGGNGGSAPQIPPSSVPDSSTPPPAGDISASSKEVEIIGFYDAEEGEFDYEAEIAGFFTGQPEMETVGFMPAWSIYSGAAGVAPLSGHTAVSPTYTWCNVTATMPLARLGMAAGF